MNQPILSVDQSKVLNDTFGDTCYLMKKEIIITWAAIVILFGVAWFKLASIEEMLEEAEEEEAEIAVPMGRMQRYADKLYFSGKAENWKLAEFYLEEIDEQAEEVEEANAFEDEVSLSSLIESMLEPQIDSLSESVKNQDKAEFIKRYGILIETCNACHAAAHHEYISIKVPAASSITNQNYTKG